MMHALVERLRERRKLKNLGSPAPDIAALEAMLLAIRHEPQSLSDSRLRRVVARASEPNWDAPPQTIFLVEEIRRAAEWALEDRSRPRPPDSGRPAPDPHRTGRAAEGLRVHSD